MPFLVSCPYCGQRSRVPERSVGGSGQCPRCGSYFTLVPAEENAAVAATMASEAPGAPPFASPPVPVNPRAGAGERVARPEPIASADEVAASKPPRAAPWGAVGLCLGAAALLSASFAGLTGLVAPLSGSGLLVSVYGLWRPRAGAGRPLAAAAAAAVSAAVLLAAWIWPALLGPVYQATRLKAPLDPAAVYVVPLPGSTRGVGRPEWVDASTAALRQGSTLVRIDHVWIGPAAADKKPQLSPASRYLFVGLQIFRAKVKDRPAQAHDPATRPKLTDDSGRSYDAVDVLPQTSAAAPSESGRIPLTPPMFLAFTPPPPAGMDLRLELPPAMLGTSESFRFTIPAGMRRLNR